MLTPRGFYSVPEIAEGVHPAETTQHAFKAALLFDASKGMARLSESGSMYHLDRGRFVPFQKETFYDGALHQEYLPRAGNSDEQHALAATQPEVFRGSTIRGALFPYPFVPCFYGSGIIPTDRLDIDPDRLEPPTDPSMFVLRSRITDQGREYLILRTKPFFYSGKGYLEFRVDPERESAIVQYSAYNGDRLVAVSEIKYQLVGERFFPSEWTSANYPRSGEPQVYSMRVVSLEIAPEVQPGEFQFQPQPGTILVDRDREYKTFVATRAGEVPLDVYLRDQAQGQGRWPFILSGAAILLAAAGAIWWWSRRGSGREHGLRDE